MKGMKQSNLYSKPYLASTGGRATKSDSKRLAEARVKDEEKAKKKALRAAKKAAKTATKKAAKKAVKTATKKAAKKAAKKAVKTAAKSEDKDTGVGSETEFGGAPLPTEKLDASGYNKSENTPKADTKATESEESKNSKDGAEGRTSDKETSK